MSITYKLKLSNLKGYQAMRGDRLRKLRDESGISQEYLASQIQSSEPQIWRYEKGEAEPRADVVVRLAEFFNVSTDYLLGVTDERGTYLQTNLTAKEAAAIRAWRRGEKYEAIRVIVADE